MLISATSRTQLVASREIPVGISLAPLALVVHAAGTVRTALSPWVLMWLVCVGIFAGLKGLTWWKARARVPHAAWRSVAYLLAWPGMDAEKFLGRQRAGLGPPRRAWLAALLKTAAGAALIWVIARRVPVRWTLFRGWVGMVGLVLLLHFGTFHLLALFWQSVGIDTLPIMDHPLRSTSLSEFWGNRWNLGFREFAHDLIFRPLQAKVGPAAAGFLVFVVSGLIHELAISLPAGAGYGFPTLYFVIQGAGVAVERSALGKRRRLRRGWHGWMFACALTAGPAFLLFHPWFVLRVIIPFLEAIHAL